MDWNSTVSECGNKVLIQIGVVLDISPSVCVVIAWHNIAKLK